MPVMPVDVTVRVTHDKRGKSLSLSDESSGTMLMVPLEPLEDILDVRFDMEGSFFG